MHPIFCQGCHQSVSFISFKSKSKTVFFPVLHMTYSSTRYLKWFLNFFRSCALFLVCQSSTWYAVSCLLTGFPIHNLFNSFAQGSVSKTTAIKLGITAVTVVLATGGITPLFCRLVTSSSVVNRAAIYCYATNTDITHIL